jgi:hypothetical protein
MNTSLLVARIMMVIYLSFGIGLLVNRDYYKKIFKHLLDNASFLVLGGIFAITVGALIISVHNIWVRDWTVLITLIGWIALFKGISLLAFSRSFSFFKSFFSSEKLTNVVTPLLLILGILFGYFGFFA